MKEIDWNLATSFFTLGVCVGNLIWVICSFIDLQKDLKKMQEIVDKKIGKVR